MSSPLAHAKIVLRRSSERGYAEHGGWLKSFHTFSFASYFDHRFMNFGSLRVLNEDRVSARNGFPTHPHRDAEIFSYILNGELTHRDSMVKKGAEGEQGKSFYRMKRGDVQFTTGGTGEFRECYPVLGMNANKRQESHTQNRTSPINKCISSRSGLCRGRMDSSHNTTPRPLVRKRSASSLFRSCRHLQLDLKQRPQKMPLLFPKYPIPFRSMPTLSWELELSSRR